MRILLIEDEPAIAADVAGALAATGYVTDIARDGEEGWFKASTEEYDALILDLGLPKLDGLSVVRRLREDGSPVPILVLTARGAWLQRVEGIDAGADDYLTKPFEMEELLARLAALLRRVGRHVTPLIEVGPLRIDTRRLRVMINGRAIELSPLEFRLLRYLAHNRDRVVSQGELVEHVYGSDEPESNAVEALVARLRRKIGAGTIETRRGHGYIMETPAP
ncbi:response regulator transcription factor [Microvirga subterranea]|uniref:DNA-binding response OmpR family regulator n=1 Tax=Microvirga subterranea TaxID=186651 RepID=A0A370HVW8_9HYPH|nr:response regulator transcription factor [Microvirga subterranea]RDI62460.1 DNA-binding response OmpR family regulator [Microvirga subterranea]